MANGKDESVQRIHMLIKKARDADKADDAMKFSQAACNAANALCALNNVVTD